MTNSRKKIVKPLLIIASILILAILAVIGVLYFEAQSYLNKNLSEFVSKKSKGKYELSFENLTINFNDWGFEIEQVSFHPSDSILKTLPHLNSSKQFYSFSSPNVRFRGIRFFNLLIRKDLEIGEIIISKPELNIHGQKSNQEQKDKNSISTLMLELKPLVTKTFKSIKIDKIELANASFDFYSLLGETRKLANAENITIGILNFYTDSLLLPDPNRMFDAKDIYLRMQNYQNKLADSIHSIHAESVTFSLKSSKIEAQNIEFKPNNDSVSIKDRYQITVPELKITSRNIRDLYLNNTIPIDSLILKGANIKYWPGQKNRLPKQDLKEEFNLYELIKKEFSSVHIQNFKLQNAQLMLFKNRSDPNTQQELKNININLGDFQLDSISAQDTSRIFYSKSIDLAASEYELTLGDNIHRIRVGSLNLSTLQKSVLFSRILIYPIQTDNSNRRNTIDANCDSVRLDLFHFKKAYHQKRFIFQKINLFNPEVKLTQNEIAEEKVKPENPSFFYNLISSYAKGIYSNQVLVQKGKMQLMNKTGSLQTGTIESMIKLQLSGFALDEISARQTDRLFFANQIELSFNNYQMQLVDHLHKLSIESFNLSTRQKQATLKNLHLFPISTENMEDKLKEYERSELYEFTIPELTLKNANFHDAFFNKRLAVDTLNIKAPQIFYENFALLKEEKPKADFEDLFLLLANYLFDIHIAKVDIPDGTVRLINHSRKGKTISLDNHFTLGLENMLINQEQFGKKKLLFSEFVDLSIRNHVIQLSDNVHVIKAEDIGFSTKKREVFALMASIYPETNSKSFPSVKWNIQLSIPEVRIKGVNIEELYFDRKIDADNLLINAPQIKLYQKQKSVNATDLKEVNIPLPKEIESIAIRQFKLNDGSLKVFSEIGIKPYLIVQSDLKMSGQNIFIQNDLATKKGPEFLKGEYTFQMVQFKFMPKDKNQIFGIDELTFSTEKRQILAKQFVVKPRTTSNTQDQFELRIPSLVMNGFDMDNAYRNDQFLFESIRVEKPSFQLQNNSKDSAKFDPYKINLYPHFESFADVFASKSLTVKEADISYFKNGKMTLQETISFDLFRLRIDNKSTQRFMHAEDFSFRIPGLKRQSKLYQYDIGETYFSSASNRFTAKDIRITPNFSKENHQKQVGFQSDYFEGKIDSVCLERPDIRRWFDKEELIGKMASVNGLKLSIYRDKRIPFDEKRRPGMFQDLIKSSKYAFKLDSFKLVNSQVTYAEQPVITDSEGIIRFSEIQVRLMPFTNIKSSNGKYPDIRMNGLATIMDSCEMKTTMNFEMNHPDNLFTASGSLSPFNMQILNPILEPLALISIRSGHVDQFQFNFSADQTKSSGNLLFGYNDLRISVLGNKNGNTKEVKFASFLANSLLLRSKNPRGKELLPDEISIPRDQKRSILNYTWKSVFSGIRNTLGIKDNKQEEPAPK